MKIKKEEKKRVSAGQWAATDYILSAFEENPYQFLGFYEF